MGLGDILGVRGRRLSRLVERRERYTEGGTGMRPRGLLGFKPWVPAGGGIINKAKKSRGPQLKAFNGQRRAVCLEGGRKGQRWWDPGFRTLRSHQSFF